MSDWYWRVIALKAAFVLTCFASYISADDNIQKLPFCNPADAATHNDLVIVSTLDGKLTAFDTQNGIKVWHVETQPLLSSNLHHVELTAGGKWVRLVPSLRGTLYSLSGETIEPLPFDAEQLLSSSFKYSDDLVIAGARETLWLGVDSRTGSVVYECGSRGCAGEQQTAGAGRDLLVLRRQSSTVRALDPRTGAEKWNFSVAEHQVALSRRECVAGNTGPATLAVAVGVALPEGVVAIRRPGERTPLWQQKLDAPVADMWRLHGGSLQHIDVLWEATQSLADGAITAPPSLYIGVHDTQLYIQESLFYAQKLETAVSTKPVPWKLMHSRPLIDGDGTALSALQNSDSNTLSLITLYGNTGQIGNHGFFLYLQETCDQAVQVSEEALAGHSPEPPPAPAPNGSDDDHHHVHVHVYSLWFWWKEVLLIAISSALLMNLMIWPRFFAPKIRSPTPLPLNQEYIVVERHYERPPSNTAEYSGRYENDFEPVRVLGRGGFGVVFEAKNKIDDRTYAVKRITLPRTEEKRERVLREVKALAKLEHVNIVRYFNAWVEEPPPNWQESRDASWMQDETGHEMEDYTTTPAPAYPSPKADSVLLNIQKPFDDCVDALEYECKRTESKRHRSHSCNDSISVVFDENATSHSQSSDTKVSSAARSHHGGGDVDDFYIEFKEPSGSAATQLSDRRLDRVMEMESYQKTDTTDTKKKKKKGHTRHWSLDMCVRPASERPPSKMYLYIQMQLCRPESLHAWLRKPHNLTWESRGDKVKRLFGQIVSAVEYIHREGLIHRDLKPSNILFAPDDRVKVGDFGLVTAMGEGAPEQPPGPAAGDRTHTYQVGTLMYMSPEQRSGQQYGFPADIYSLGLILFELLHPFGTEAERFACFKDVRRRHYSKKFQHAHPTETGLLKMMLSEDPSQRPTASALRACAPAPADDRWHFALPDTNLAVAAVT